MRKKIEAIIFDIDGVLVDTRQSYLESICITTELYLTKVLGLSKQGGPLLTLKDVECFKMLGGFNNDWDCVEGLLYYFLSLGWDSPRSGTVPSLQKLKKKKNIAGLLKRNDKSFLRRKYLKPLIAYDLIVDIFQEVYLGPKVYKSHYRKKPRFWKNAGLHLKEKLLQPAAFYRKLKNNGLKLGIATGRTRFETLMVLNRFRLKSFFRSIVTADETQKPKPDPFVLLKSAGKLKVKNLAYVGDLPDDIKTARNASRKGLSVRGIGYLKGVSEKSIMRREMFRRGAFGAADTPAQLAKLLDKLR